MLGFKTIRSHRKNCYCDYCGGMLPRTATLFIDGSHCCDICSSIFLPVIGTLLVKGIIKAGTGIGLDSLDTLRGEAA